MVKKCSVNWCGSRLLTAVVEPKSDIIGEVRRYSNGGYSSANVLLNVLLPGGPTICRG